MGQSPQAARPFGWRLMGLCGFALAMLLVLGIGTRLAHTTTIPNVGLPPSNSKSIPNLRLYEPQTSVASDYLSRLASLDYAGAYEQLAPAVRNGLSREQFREQRKVYGQLGRPTVWIDDSSSVRAEFVLVKPDGTAAIERHRFLLTNEQGHWWMGEETSIPPLPSTSMDLPSALKEFVVQRAGKIWAESVELLRQEAFDGGQLLLFSYIEPHPANVLTPQRIALLNYYVNQPGGWHFSGGGTTGHPAGMAVSDVAMGIATFGENDRYLAYFGVVENANTQTLSFAEPNGAKHTFNLKGETTVLFLNERNPFEPPPFDRPFTAITAKDGRGNSLRTNPPPPGAGNGIGD